MWPWNCYKYDDKDREIQRLNAEIAHLKAVCHYTPDYLTESREELLKLELSDAKREIRRLNDAINPHSLPIQRYSNDWYSFTLQILNKDKEIKKLKRTLEQYEKDERDNYDKIQHVEHENQRLRDKIVDVSTRNIENHKELAMYKEFFAGNEVKVFLKDKEVPVDCIVKGSED